MFVKFPREVSALASLAAKESHRYTMTNVNVRDLGTGYWQVEATNGKVLGRATGNSIPETGAPCSVLLKASDVKDLAASARKAKVSELTVQGEGEVLDGIAGPYSSRLEAQDGRFPDTDVILKDTESKPAVRVKVNPALLAELMKVASAILGDENQSVELAIIDDVRPIRVTGCNTSVKFEGLLMPLT